METKLSGDPLPKKRSFSVKVGAHNGERVSGKVPETFRLWGTFFTKTEIRQRNLTSFSFINQIVENSYTRVVEALYQG
jgi:hypothetical protein